MYSDMYRDYNNAMRMSSEHTLMGPSLQCGLMSRTEFQQSSGVKPQLHPGESDMFTLSLWMAQAALKGCVKL